MSRDTAWTCSQRLAHRIPLSFTYRSNSHLPRMHFSHGLGTRFSSASKPPSCKSRVTGCENGRQVDSPKVYRFSIRVLAKLFVLVTTFRTIEPSDCRHEIARMHDGFRCSLQQFESCHHFILKPHMVATFFVFMFGVHNLICPVDFPFLNIASVERETNIVLGFQESEEGCVSESNLKLLQKTKRLYCPCRDKLVAKPQPTECARNCAPTSQ